MILVRLVLIAVVLLTASLSAAMDAGHLTGAGHDHAVVDMTADDQLMCCDDGTERSQSCQTLPVILTGSYVALPLGPASRKAQPIGCLFLAGITPSGLLDPPRIR